MDIKIEHGDTDRLLVSKAYGPGMNVKVEPGVDTNSSLKFVSELWQMPEPQSGKEDPGVKIEPTDLCTHLSPELPDTGVNADLGGVTRCNTAVVVKAESEDQADIPVSGQLSSQDILELNGSSEEDSKPQPVMLVENMAHPGCISVGPGTSADYALMSLVKEPTRQVIAVCLQAGDGTYSDCTVNAVVEDIAFVASGEGGDPNILGNEEEPSDDDVVIVETEKKEELTPSCSTVTEPLNKAMEIKRDESESSEGSGSSDESTTSSDEADAVPTPKFECQYCGKAFSTKFYLGKHERLHKGEKPYKCKQCSRYFSAMWKLIDHMHSHAKALDYMCKYCGETFKNGSYWRQHERAHTNQRLHCDLCGRVFIKKLYLLYHKKSFHGLDVKNKPLKCSSCPKTFHRIQDLDLHQIVHMKHFECNQCGEKFNFKHLMLRHKTQVHLSL